MKKKYIILGVIGLFIVATFIWWCTPTTFLSSIDANEITSIHVRNGNNGNIFEIKTQKDIKYIIDNFQKHSFEKDGVSLFRKGTWYTLTFYNQHEKEVSKFIVNSNNTIRKDPFFYRINDGELQTIIDYLDNLEKIN